MRKPGGGETIMPKGKEKIQNKDNKPPELTITEQTLLSVVRDNPGLSPWQAAKKASLIRQNTSPDAFYKAFTRSVYLQREVSNIKQGLRDYIDEKQMPEAMGITDDALKCNDPEQMKVFRDKYNFVKLIYDKSLGDSVIPHMPTTINIGQVQALIQTQVRDKVDKDEDVIEVE